jgi:crotonobetainyl-CoA:carnitine CoA-transferase CaiB-like acyl-CoA transferase
MSDGVTSLLAFPASQLFAAGMVPKPGVEMLNGGAPYYAVYECSDGKWLSIGCIEPWFWSELCNALGLEEHIPQQMNREKAPEIFEALRAKFKEKTRDAWFEELRTRDICIGPIYALDEVFEDPHAQARNMVVEIDHPEYGKVKQVGVGPKFSDTPGSVRTTGPARGAHTADLLREVGYTDAQIEEMRTARAAG